MSEPPLPRSSPIVLAKEADFQIGSLLVRPSRCQVERSGSQRDVQPRVMQVLVALATATTDVVPTAELIQRCWQGLNVTDDAVTRCIGQLRKLAESWGEPPFAIETIKSVGYRLIRPDMAAVPNQTPVEGETQPRRSAKAATGMLLALAALAGAGLIWTQPSLWHRGGSTGTLADLAARVRAGDTPHIQVAGLTAVGAGGETRSLAGNMGTEIAGTLSENGAQMVVAPPGSRPTHPPDFTLGGSLEKDGDRLRIRLLLEGPAASELLWSQVFEGKAADRDALRDAAVSAAGETIYAAMDALRQKGVAIDAETMALAIRGAALIEDKRPMQEGEARRTFETLIARAPHLAQGHGGLAIALVNEAAAATGTSREALLKRGEAEAHTAIDIDPASAGTAFDALYKASRLRQPQAIAAAEDILLGALRKAPDFAFLNMRECGALIGVGRAQAALPYCQRALALRPFAEPIPKYYLRALYLAGSQAKAEQAAKAAKLFIHAPATLDRQFDLAILGDRPGDAQRLLEDPATTPPSISDDGRPAVAAALKALRTRQPVDIDAAAESLRTAAAKKQVPVMTAALLLTKLDRPDALLTLLQELVSVHSPNDQLRDVLVDPALKGVRKGPRFWRLTAQTGLLPYWRARSIWPDFCAGDMTVTDCKAAAASAERSQTDR